MLEYLSFKGEVSQFMGEGVELKDAAQRFCQKNGLDIHDWNVAWFMARMGRGDDFCIPWEKFTRDQVMLAVERNNGRPVEVPYCQNEMVVYRKNGRRRLRRVFNDDPYIELSFGPSVEYRVSFGDCSTPQQLMRGIKIEVNGAEVPSAVFGYLDEQHYAGMRFSYRAAETESGQDLALLFPELNPYQLKEAALRISDALAALTLLAGAHPSSNRTRLCYPC